MEKKIKYILIGILILFVVLRISGAIGFFNHLNISNEPNLKMNSRSLGTNFIKPKRLDFSYYETDDKEFGKIIMVQRLIALSGDKLECKDGTFYVNDVNMDENINLRRMYVIKESDFSDDIREKVAKDVSIVSYKYEAGKLAITLDDDDVLDLSISVNRLKKYDNTDVSKDILLKEEWNIDNFGPITVPESKYFYVGDNRDKSFDSRHIGFVDEEKIKGTLLFQF